jgi:cation:H+ antiporter
MLTLVTLLLGFILLVKGADFFVEASSLVAKRLRVSPLIIGLTIVAFGTSAPELAVSLLAALRGSSDIALGNIVGSNLANIGLILGFTAILYPLKVQSNTITKEIPFMILGALVLLILAADKFWEGEGAHNLLSKPDGLIFLLFFVIFLYYLFGTALQDRKESVEVEEEFAHEFQTFKPESNIKTLTKLVGGLAGIVLGGQLVVNGGIEVARVLGVSEALIGLTIVAVGTSLPELVTSVTAALKKEADIALGNVVGSNIFNTFFILGTTASISPIAVQSQFLVDLILLIFVSILALFLAFSGRKVTRSEGIFFALIYLFYLGFLVIRG